MKQVQFDSNELATRWKETRYALPKVVTVPSRVFDKLHMLHPDFTYTEISFVEAPNGNYYTFVDGTTPDRLEYNIGEN